MTKLTKKSKYEFRANAIQCEALLKKARSQRAKLAWLIRRLKSMDGDLSK